MRDESRGRRRRRRWVVLAIWVSIILGIAGFFWPRLGGNFGVLDADRVYRSAQPGPELASVIRERKLASILNLRGGSGDDPWYADEVLASRQGGVDFYDFPMSARRRPSRRELLVLLDFFDRCRYPLLIHCKSGSDRTGLACALYLMSRKAVGPDEAEGAFSLAYRHVPLLGPEHLHEPIREYRAWLAGRHLSHSAGRFREWVERDYKSGPDETPPRTLRPGPRALAGSNSPDPMSRR